MRYCKSHATGMAISALALFSVMKLIHLATTVSESRNEPAALPNGNCSTACPRTRKMLQFLPLTPPPSSGDGGDQNRMGKACSKDDIIIYQGSTMPLPSGIPSYTVQILNACVSQCSITDIHVNCGWFSSSRLVNPLVFRRVNYDDCLVNDGEPLGPGDTLSFQYASTFQYPLSVSSVACI